MSSNYTTTLPADILLDSGLLYAYGSGSAGISGSAPIGVSRGGLTFDAGRELRNVDFDGKKSMQGGLDRIVSYTPKIEGTMIEFGTAAVARFEPNSTLSSGSVSVVTPIAASTLLATSSYISNLRLVFARGNGQYVQVRFPWAVCTKYDIKGKDNEEAEVAVTYEARLSGSNTDTAPYVIEYMSTLAI